MESDQDRVVRIVGETRTLHPRVERATDALSVVTEQSPRALLPFFETEGSALCLYNEVK